MFYTEDIDATPVMPQISPARTTKRHYFQDGSTHSGTPATVVEKDFLNMVQNELCNAVEAVGLKLDKTDHTQLTQAIRLTVGNFVEENSSSLFGIPLWDRNECYDPLPWIVWGSDLMLYVALLPSGICISDVGAKDPTTTTGYWLSLPKWLMQFLDNDTSSVPQHRQVITASGIFTATEDAPHEVTCISGGGGGGGGAAWTNGSSLWYAPGGGAGASGYTITRTISLKKGQSINVTIGAGGTAGKISSEGGNGGNTSFGGMVMANGGGGGGAAGATSAGSAAGKGSKDGVYWGTSGEIYVGSRATGAISNSGGICASAFCVDNQVYGRGGGGGAASASSGGATAHPGQAGTSGVCVVKW